MGLKVSGEGALHAERGASSLIELSGKEGSPRKAFVMGDVMEAASAESGGNSSGKGSLPLQV